MFVKRAEHRGAEGQVKGRRRQARGTWKGQGCVWLLPLHDNFCFPLHLCGLPCTLLARTTRCAFHFSFRKDGIQLAVMWCSVCDVIQDAEQTQAIL